MLRRCLALLLLALGLAAVPRPAAAAPAPESALAGVVQVTTGWDHACALLDSGTVKCWGSDASGQVGNGGKGAEGPFAEPVRVIGVTGTRPLAGVVQVSAGQDHTCALLATTKVACWGGNADNLLGGGTQVSSRPRPILVRNPTNTGDLTGVVQIEASSDHTCAVLDNGQARCWGDNVVGQLGNQSQLNGFPRVVQSGKPAGGPLTGVQQIATARNLTCALLTNGQVRCWGGGFSGALGNGLNENSPVPVTVLGVTAATLTGATQVDVGFGTSCARLASGKAVCWGLGSSGRLGDGTEDDSNRPGVVADPQGDDDLTDVRTVSMGETHGCAVLTGGQVRCWSANLSGQLGDGTEDTAVFPVVTRNPRGTAALRNVTQLDTGSAFTCATLANGQVRCWGANADGQLGNGGFDPSSLPVVVHLQ
jgi:alpha-tubulin suppressor-like RCC1 family protein